MRILLLALVAVVCASACSTPLASRRAQVLERGEVEFVAVPTAVLALGANGLVLPLPHLEGSVRFGIFQNVDLQLKLDEALFPELSFGWQILGDPHANDFAMTVTAGAKVGFLPVPSFFGSTGSLTGNANLPLQLLFDIPISEEGAIYLGTRTIIGSTFGLAGSGQEPGLAVTPGIVIGLSQPFGAFVFQPELAMNYALPLVGPSLTGSAVFVALGVGFGGHFDLSDLKSKKAAPTETTK